MRILMVNVTRMVQDSGGLAKVTCTFSNEMVKRGHEVALAYSDETEGEFFYPMDKKVKLYNINKQEDGSLLCFPGYLKLAREILRLFGQRVARTLNAWYQKKYLLGNLKKCLDEFQPDIVVSYQPFAHKLLLCDLDTKIPVIAMSHGDPEEYFQYDPVEALPAFGKSAINQVLVPAYEEHIKKYMPEAKTITIGNAIPQFDFQADLSAEKEVYKIVFVGRLAKGHKQPHLLIEAFAKLASKYPNWQVELWGAKQVVL